MDDSKQFITGLKQDNLALLRKIAKTDYHNHALYGGDRNYIYNKTGIMIKPITCSIDSPDTIDLYVKKFSDNILLSDKEYYDLMFDASIIQAGKDGVKKIMLSIDAWCIYTIYGGNISYILNHLSKTALEAGFNIDIKIQVGISRYAAGKDLEKWFEPLWGDPCVTSIDLYGPENVGNIDVFKKIYTRSKKYNWLRVAHVGEFLGPEIIEEYIEALDLQHINHGINAYMSNNLIAKLKERNTILHVCPSSNLLLGRISALSFHPIKYLYRSGVRVTINSDDLLVFGSTVSEEYLKLYQAHVLSAEELDDIRTKSLDLDLSMVM